MRLPVGPLGLNKKELTEFHRTGKLPERTVEATSDPIRDRYRLEGELEGRREGYEDGLRDGRERQSERLEEERRKERHRFAKQSGNAPKKEKPWVPYARTLALKIKNPAAPDSAIAKVLAKQWLKKKPAEWEGEKPDCPAVDTLRKFVTKLREDGTLPPRPKRPGTTAACLK